MTVRLESLKVYDERGHCYRKLNAEKIVMSNGLILLYNRPKDALRAMVTVTGVVKIKDGEYAEWG